MKTSDPSGAHNWGQRRERSLFRHALRGILRTLHRLHPLLRPGALRRPDPKPSHQMETIIFGVIALALLLYLVVAVLLPEKF